MKIDGIEATKTLHAPVEMGEAVRNVMAATARGLNRLPAEPLPKHDARMAIVGYGPSLRDRWRAIKNPAITVSGAHDFLIERGFVPQFHLECDPRPHKARSLEKPHKDVQYLIASNCAPKLFDNLNGFNTQLWHADEKTGMVKGWAMTYDPGTAIINGGSNAGLRAIAMGMWMGYRKFDLFGMDCCFTAMGQHAGAHYGRPQQVVNAKVCGKNYASSLAMVEAAEYVVKMIDTLDIEIFVFGESLLKTMVMEAYRQLKEIRARKAKLDNDIARIVKWNARMAA